MLVADDDPAIVKLVARRCGKMGFEVDTATNGVQALMKANRNPPDILVLDLNMPEADGFSVCERLLDPSRRPLSVIVVTGGRDPEAIERCESYGADYIRKDSEFWNNFTSALAITFPTLAGVIGETTQQSECEVRSRPRVLVVDDDADIQKFLFSRLSKRGIDMLFASTAEQGHRLARKEGPSVIVSDYAMPNGDATYLLSRLRNTPETRETPVIIFSGRRLDGATQRNLLGEVSGRSGASLVLKKSFDTDELFAALGKFCAFER
jgi:CheY-like chemotaxis protein